MELAAGADHDGGMARPDGVHVAGAGDLAQPLSDALSRP